MSDTFAEACRHTVEQALTEPGAMLVVAAAFPDRGGIIETRRGKPDDLYWAARRVLEMAQEDYEKLVEEGARGSEGNRARARFDAIRKALALLPDPSFDDDDDGEDD